MVESPPPDGLVLAAGGSGRMGRPKALLEIAGETFLDHAIRVLREGGCRSVYVVAGDAPELHAIVAAQDARLVRNDDPASEQFTSVKLGMRALPADSAAVAVLPVDCPLVQSSTVQTLAVAAARTAKPVVLPMYNGVGGHPVILMRSFFDTVLGARNAEGLSGVIIAHGHKVELVTVMDAGILVDIDTPQEYERFIAGTGFGSESDSGGEGGAA